MSRQLLGGLVLPLILAACGAVTPQNPGPEVPSSSLVDPGADSGVTGVRTCSTGTGAAVPECQTEFCAPGTLAIVANAAPGLRCTGFGGAATCQGNADYQAFEYKDDNLYLYLSFKPAIASGYSDAAFKANFDYLWLNVYFPQANTDHTTFFSQTAALRGLSSLVSFSYTSGRLQGRLHIPIKRVDQLVNSTNSACIADDIAGRCYCSYPAETDATIDFDLAVQPQ